MISWIPKKLINNQRVQELLIKSIESNQFTNGSPCVKLLEERVRDILQIDASKSVVCVSNGTVALWAAVAAMELYHKKDLQFVTQSFTFPASAQGYLDNVVIVDIDQEGGPDLSLIDVSACDGIIVTNVFGNVVDIQKYENWCSTHNKFLIFDNAATANTFYKGKNSSNYGTVATLSFHHTKPIGFGEGGCIIIDSKYERSLRNIMNFGIDNTEPLTAKWHRRGGNYKMSDLQAVYILQYLDNFDKIVETTITNYNYFLNQTKDLSIRLFPNFSDRTPFVSCITFFSDKSDLVIKELLKCDIYCRKYYNPLEPTPVATEFYNSIVCISFHVNMTFVDIDRIIEIIKRIV
jgi:dTDP-4-amino-4,6-dideoxygalactose transaminase